MQKKYLGILLLIIFFISLFTTTIGAQTTYTDLGVAVSISAENIEEGDIVCSDTAGYVLCTNEYSSSIYGVVDDLPTFSISEDTSSGKRLVVSKGETIVKVSTQNGPIKKGDFLTSSKTPGVAMLATKTGYVIGNALEDYSSEDTSAVGSIKITENIHARTDIVGNTRENLLDILRSGLSGLGVNPISALRYILASAMVIVSFVIGFTYFGRIAKTGVEAIGRNPLAGLRIQASVILNIAIMLGVLAAGLGVAYLILAL